MKVKAQLNNLRITPQKVRLVIDSVRGKKVSDALGILDYDLKKPADVIAKLIRSAVANAQHNHKLLEKDLIIAEIMVGDGPTLKRWRPRAYGRASKILKRTSRVSLVLSDGKDEKTEVKEIVKKLTKKTVKKATKKVAKKA